MKLELLKPDIVKKFIPLFLHRIRAGFPSPTLEGIDKPVDLHELLNIDEICSYFMRVGGDFPYDDRIRDGDILVIDRSLEVKYNTFVVVGYKYELRIKFITERDGKFFMSPDHPDGELVPFENAELWGVVTFVIHKT